jgi:hypothetical protein
MAGSSLAPTKSLPCSLSTPSGCCAGHGRRRCPHRLLRAGGGLGAPGLPDAVAVVGVCGDRPEEQLPAGSLRLPVIGAVDLEVPDGLPRRHNRVQPAGAAHGCTQISRAANARPSSSSRVTTPPATPSGLPRGRSGGPAVGRDPGWRAARMPTPRRPRPGKAGAGISSRWLARLDSTAAIAAGDASSAARPNDVTALIAGQRPGTEVTRHRGTERESTELFDLALTEWLISRLRQPRRIDMCTINLTGKQAVADTKSLATHPG